MAAVREGPQPMVTDAQVRLLRQKRMDGKTQEAAAAAAGMSVRTAREWERGPLPSESRQPRMWRTRSDPFESVWSSEIVPLLQADEAGVLQATTIFDWLEDRHPDRFPAGQLRTLQRRVREWRALHGGEREVFFPQQHPPGREAQLDVDGAQEARDSGEERRFGGAGFDAPEHQRASFLSGARPSVDVLSRRGFREE